MIWFLPITDEELFVSNDFSLKIFEIIDERNLILFINHFYEEVITVNSILYWLNMKLD